MGKTAQAPNKPLSFERQPLQPVYGHKALEPRRGKAALGGSVPLSHNMDLLFSPVAAPAGL